MRNTMLAVAACHLRHMVPCSREHRIAEHFQQGLALRDYQNALNLSRDSLGQNGANVMLFSANLLNMLAFALPPSEVMPCDKTNNADQGSAWVFGPGEDRLGWLALQAGMRPLLISTSAYINGAMDFFGLVYFRATEREKPGSVRVSLSLPDLMRNVPEIWVNVLDLDPGQSSTTGSCECSTHHDPTTVMRVPAAVLAGLRDVKPFNEHVFQALVFVSKVQREFRTLLHERDVRAFWLFGYWLGLMQRFEGAWWCQMRAKRDYDAILLWLEHLRLEDRPGTRGGMWKDMMAELRMAPYYNER